MAPRRKRISLLIEGKLLSQAEKIFKTRKVSLSDAFSLYLRAAINADKFGKLSLRDEMPIGKYRGMEVETIIRLEPKYMLWIISQDNTTIKLHEDAEALLMGILEEK